jgi:hypothetical protein
MKFLACIYLTAGGSLSVFILHVVHGLWADIGGIIAFAAVPNALTGVLGYLQFISHGPDAMTQRFLLIASYLTGFCLGVYLFYS